MMSIPHTPTIDTLAPSAPRRHARLQVKSEQRATGHVDGAWWPCSRDLTAELPELLEDLATTWGPCERVTYSLPMWEPVARKLVVDGRRVRVEGFNSQPPETVTVIGGQGRGRLTLLVVPPETAPASARASLAAASQGGNTDTVDRLLGFVDTADMAASTQRWELDGGLVR
ncbi:MULTISPECIES: DUF5994 family protein [Prauserella salsuginis group]|uniref:Uncharacterized protein n=2 Tax=Prauserella salsuginis group TaxID=2893672 RepID=A0A839XUY8_9PSEU|nr:MULTISPECIES: DUF5994 family protein [Prauserella salsuginis group]MBB3663635.1 hypothetical protein [Prauserella sediminis]MCR3722583.1 hypothetical protein [Prauserella flava]MCR3737025.1 hypothetical protein [Prauserella salsuginis]